MTLPWLRPLASVLSHHVDLDDGVTVKLVRWSRAERIVYTTSEKEPGGRDGLVGLRKQQEQGRTAGISCAPAYYRKSEKGRPCLAKEKGDPSEIEIFSNNQSVVPASKSQ